MRVYLVRFDGDERVVEAKNFGDAIEVWRDGMKEGWGQDWRPNDEPNSVELISDDPVIRREPSDGVLSPETEKLLRKVKFGGAD